MSEDNSAAHLELELKYQVAEPSADEILPFLAAAEALGDFTFGPATKLHNHDTYFDLNGRDLSLRQGSLRTRLVNDEEYLITLKLQRINGSGDGDGVHSRNEIEAAPSKEVIAEIWGQLERIGLVKAPFVPLDLLRIGVEGTLLSWGLEKLFHAENQRITRPIYTDGDTRVGELFLDDVTLLFEHKHSHIYEIEIEAQAGQAPVLSALSALLQEKFGEAIEPSRKSKYERGLAFIGLKDDNKIETKFLVEGQIGAIVEQLQQTRQIVSFRIESDIQYDIHDVYYDTPGPEQRLRANHCYLRLRRSGDEFMLTFRMYQVNDEQQLIETHQIKTAASPEALSQTIEYLVQEGIIEVVDTAVPLPDEPHDMLIASGLRPSLQVDTHRRLFPVYDHAGEPFANIKLDDVTFSLGDKKAQHAEIEISTTREINLISVGAIAHALNTRFPLKPISKPKYAIGLELIHTGQLSDRDIEEPIRIHARTNLDLTKTPQPEAAKKPPLTLLRENLTEFFNEEELRTLCFDLGLTYDGLGGDDKGGRARELIEYMQRHGRLEELVALAERTRPNVTWRAS